MTDAEIIAAIRQHAEQNYERDGWDFLVECWSDADVADAAGLADRPRPGLVGALDRCHRAVKYLDEYRSEIQSA